MNQNTSKTKVTSGKQETVLLIQSYYSLLVLNTRRIVLMGKTGAGKSNAGNTIFGETVFQISDSPNSETSICQAESRSVEGRSVTLVDTPGFCDIAKSEEQLKPETVRCITECAPGPHAFLIVLKVEKFTHQEEEVITKISEYFSAEAFRYAAVLFTHGDQLREGMTIQEFVNQSERLNDLVKKCGGRCHVIDNKYWNNNQQDNYRSNQFQVAELLRTVDKIVEENNGGCYTNEMLQAVEREIQQEEESIMTSSGNTSRKEAREIAKTRVVKKFLIKFAGAARAAAAAAATGGAAAEGAVAAGVAVAAAAAEGADMMQLRGQKHQEGQQGRQLRLSGRKLKLA
uniref:GTPase IMAP family member 7-like n=1 Tax=Centroberyx gerrardi TaxID=166262 RepID=UPI003AAF99D2